MYIQVETFVLPKPGVPIIACSLCTQKWNPGRQLCEGSFSHHIHLIPLHTTPKWTEKRSMWCELIWPNIKIYVYIHHQLSERQFWSKKDVTSILSIIWDKKYPDAWTIGLYLRVHNYTKRYKPFVCNFKRYSTLKLNFCSFSSVT